MKVRLYSGIKSNTYTLFNKILLIRYNLLSYYYYIACFHIIEFNILIANIITK